MKYALWIITGSAVRTVTDQPVTEHRKNLCCYLGSLRSEKPWRWFSLSTDSSTVLPFCYYFSYLNPSRSFRQFIWTASPGYFLKTLQFCWSETQLGIAQFRYIKIPTCISQVWGSKSKKSPRGSEINNTFPLQFISQALGLKYEFLYIGNGLLLMLFTIRN